MKNQERWSQETRSRSSVSIAWTFLSVLLWTASLSAVAAEDPQDVALDLMRGYWRYHFTFSPARICQEALERDAASNAGGLGDWLKRHRVDVNEPSLGHPFYYQYPYCGHGGSSPLTYLITSPPPPPEWMTPDFDGSAWPRRRLPFLTWSPYADGWAGFSQGIGLACFRSRFIVNDPARIQGITLELGYRGGAMVYLNGKEVARGHLPVGELAPDTPGAPYPLRAYVLPPTDIGPYGPRPGTPRPFPELGSIFPGPDAFIRDRADKYKPPISELTSYYRQGGGHAPITRKEWEELKALRDRRLVGAEIPPRLLRKGVNVLAVEIHRSDLHPVVLGDERLGTHRWGYFGGYNWFHGYLLEAELKSRPPGLVLPERRPGGIQVWTDDIHRRCFSTEFGPIQKRIAPILIVGARNGAYSGQVILGTSKKLSSVRARMGDLLHTKSKEKLPGSCTLVRYGKGRPIVELAALGTDRGAPRWRRPEQCPDLALALARHSSGSKGIAEIAEKVAIRRTLSKKEQAALAQAAQAVLFFDQLSGEPPAAVPRDSCLPVWVTIKVPENASRAATSGDFPSLPTRSALRSL